MVTLIILFLIINFKALENGQKKETSSCQEERCSKPWWRAIELKYIYQIYKLLTKILKLWKRKV